MKKIELRKLVLLFSISFINKWNKMFHLLEAPNSDANNFIFDPIYVNKCLLNLENSLFYLFNRLKYIGLNCRR